MVRGPLTETICSIALRALSSRASLIFSNAEALGLPVQNGASSWPAAGFADFIAEDLESGEAVLAAGLVAAVVAAMATVVEMQRAAAVSAVSHGCRRFTGPPR